MIRASDSCLALLLTLGVCLLPLTAACGNETTEDIFSEEEEIDPVLLGPDSRIGTGVMEGSGRTEGQYEKADVSRDGVNYLIMANGWGPKFESQTISWNGTAFTVESMSGTQGDNYEPASYPTVFCGQYSDSVSGECGLPAEIRALTSLKTGWMWNPNTNDGQYNAAYDVWLANGPDRSSFSGYFMVWYRNPAGQNPAGSFVGSGTVADIPGKWAIYSGTVNNRPIINYVRSPGRDTQALEFDLLDFIRDAESRGLDVPGTHILSVAVGFEIWSGPITNLESQDFYVDVQ